MRNLALSVAAILVLAVASPAFAQPFADVPTDHWAFDAIAELAAKGIIEGFPDGTFKGDRGVSRYEVAIIVARILARIEAIKIPAPAPAAAPQVTRTDVQTIQRLVNEFRAELAALGVRTTAVEEELTALKANASNVTIKGDVRLRYNASAIPTPPFTAAQYRHRITITGKPSSTVSVTTRVRTSGTGGSQISPLQSFTAWPVISFDYAYADVKGVFGTTWRVGEQPYTLGGSGWSGYGLLYDPTNAGVFSTTNVVGGAKFSGTLAGFGYEVGAWSEVQANAFNIYTLGVNLGQLLPGWSFSVNGIYQSRIAPSTVPITTNAAAGATATSAGSTNDTGYEAVLTGALMPGLTLGANYATFNPGAATTVPVVSNASSNAYIGWVALDLTSFGMAGQTLTAWYKNYGTGSQVQLPFHSGASTEIGDYPTVTWNFNGFGAALDAKFGGGWSGSFSYESGNTTLTPTVSVQEYYANVGYTLSPNTTLGFYYYNEQLGGAPVGNNQFYRVQLSTSY